MADVLLCIGKILVSMHPFLCVSYLFYWVVDCVYASIDGALSSQFLSITEVDHNICVYHTTLTL
jgi:hypothetical protein